MNATMLAVPNEPERQLAAGTERDALAALDEDAAIELEARVRRARNKYVGQHRRGAAARVAERGARGRARPENKRALRSPARKRLRAGTQAATARKQARKVNR